MPQDFMEEPQTARLASELTDAPDLDGYLCAHGLRERSLADFLNQTLADKGLRRVDVIHRASINETFGYQIFTGTRKPSRDYLLRLALAMELGVPLTDRMLAIAGAGRLYPKVRRDAIIIFALAHGWSVQRTDEELFGRRQETLCG